MESHRQRIARCSDLVEAVAGSVTDSLSQGETCTLTMTIKRGESEVYSVSFVIGEF